MPSTSKRASLNLKCYMDMCICTYIYLIKGSKIKFISIRKGAIVWFKSLYSDCPDKQLEYHFDTRLWRLDGVSNSNVLLDNQPGCSVI